MCERMAGKTAFRRLGVVCAVLGVLAVSAPALAQWPQLGGPNRDFKAKTSGLAESWPEAGPKELWSRELGSGDSSIVVDGGRLFTMYRDAEEEVVIAMDADSGKTIWEHRYAAKIPEGLETKYGQGPHATPTVENGRVYTLGVTGVLNCLNLKTGKVAWSHDLVKEFGAKTPEYGFASSPVAYKNWLIAAVGGKGVGMMAFDLASGSVVWKKHDFENIYSSPIINEVYGQDQAFLLTDREIVGVSPTNGNLLWKFKHENQWKTNISTPVWGDGNLLFVSSGGDAGSRVLKLTQAGGKTKVAETWAAKKLGVGQSNVIRIGELLCVCAGQGRNAFIAGINLETGKESWRETGYPKAQMIYADGKLIVLDENGVLTLAKVTPESFTVRSTTKVFDDRSWTIPTIVGTRLFMRDKEKIVALDLG